MNTTSHRKFTKLESKFMLILQQFNDALNNLVPRLNNLVLQGAGMIFKMQAVYNLCILWHPVTVQILLGVFAIGCSLKLKTSCSSYAWQEHSLVFGTATMYHFHEQRNSSISSFPISWVNLLEHSKSGSQGQSSIETEWCGCMGLLVVAKATWWWL